MKRYVIGLLPLLVTAAFAVAPAMAQAAEQYGVCSNVGPGGEYEVVGAKCNFVGGGGGEFEFEAFGVARHSVVSKGTTKYVLENAAENAGIECSALSDAGTEWNEGGVGHSSDSLYYTGCKPILGLALECESINPATGNEISGTASNLVTGPESVKITITSGFDVICLNRATKEEENFGPVTGSVTGNAPVGTNELIFVKAAGLTFLTQPSTITGTNTTETSNNEPVYIY